MTIQGDEEELVIECACMQQNVRVHVSEGIG